MLRKASVLLGLAVLLSLLFPVKSVLAEAGVDFARWRLPGLDLAALCVLVALLPACVLFHDARLTHRIPAWSAWVALLALSSLLFLLLHVSWSNDLAASYAQQALAAADGQLPGLSHLSILDGAELAARLGVLVSLVAVLLRLDAMPDDDAPVPRRKK